MAQHVETLVIGGGPAGLASAYVLAKAGREVTVLEMNSARVGGLTQDGFTFATKSPDVAAFWDEILPDGFVERPIAARLYQGRKFYAYPLKALETLAKLGAWTAAKGVASLGWARLNPIAAPATLQQHGRNRFGEALFSRFFHTHAEKVWGLSCEAMPAEGIGQPVVEGGTLRCARDGVNPWVACAQTIVALGGEVRLGRKVDGLHYDKLARIWTVSVACVDGRKEIYTADNVVSSAPLRELMQVICPTPISLFHACELMYRDLVTVTFVGAEAGADGDIHVHDPAVKAARVQTRGAATGLDYYCFEGDGVWLSSDQDLIAQARRDLAAMGLSTDAKDVAVARHRKAAPIHDEDSAEHLKMIRLDLKMGFPGLHLVGRNGLHRAGQQDHAVMTGVLAAENIVAGERLHDVWAVEIDATYAGVLAPPPALDLIDRKAA
jgi:protoporphyrinogen oxidase